MIKLDPIEKLGVKYFIRAYPYAHNYNCYRCALLIRMLSKSKIPK